MLKMDDFAGTLAMIRLMLRRDKIIIPLFVIFVVLFVLFVATSFINLYSDDALRMAFYLQMQSNPTVVALLGKVLDPSIGGLTAWRIGFGISLIIGLINLFLMVRHTRSEERKGRLEMIDSAPVGKQATLSAALLTTFGVNLLIAILVGLGLMAQGLPVYSSFVLGLSIAAFGCLFAAITGVSVQLTESSGDTRYLIVALLVLFFIVRIIGWDDGDYTWVSWLSPYGWMHEVAPFAGDHIWVFGIFLIFTAGFSALALWFSSLRDLGAGIIAQRPGSPRAAKSLRSSLALAWRLHRGMLFFWIILFMGMGFLLGAMAQIVTDVVTTNPQFVTLILQLGGNAGLTDSYFTMVLAFLGEIFAFYAILATLKLHSQESNQYSEVVLTSSVSRRDWAVSNLIFAVLGPAIVVILYALSCGFGYAFITNDFSEIILRILGAALAYLPAIWLFTGIAMVLFGLIPRLASMAWAALAVVVIIDLLGEFSDINQNLLNLSPFTYVPRLMAGDSGSGSLILLFVLAVMLIIVGIWGYERRDITG